LLFIRRSFQNPRGLNEIIFETTGCIVNTDDWDKNVPAHIHMGKLKDSEVKGRISQLWGTMLEKYAFLYLKDKLKGSGWKLKRGQKISGKEYDCLGWKGKIKDAEHPDLAIEMHFPKPDDEDRYDLPFVVEKTRRMREKLRKIDAKYKYALLGVPQGKILTTLEIVHSDMKTVYQRYRFGDFKILKQQVLRP
jgi:hypothetical protein